LATFLTHRIVSLNKIRPVSWRRYSFRRTGAANILRNPLVLLLATCAPRLLICCFLLKLHQTFSSTWFLRASAASGLAFFMCTVAAGYAVKFLFFIFDWDRDYSPESWFALDLQHFMLGAVGALFSSAISLDPRLCYFKALQPSVSFCSSSA
jgi:hypothetical protein